MDYRIGLDVGISSVGWCVIEHDQDENPMRIVVLGVRCFDVAEVPKTGAALASVRRESRGARRRTRRRRYRLDQVIELFEKYNIISSDRIKELFKESPKNIYEIRNRALTDKISNEELALVLYHIAKHRGFKSTRKAETNDKETGKLLNATAENKKLMNDGGYKTVGQMLYNDPRFRSQDAGGNVILTVRNKADNYQNSILRDMLIEEVKTIFAAQKELGNNISDDFLNDYIKRLSSQRPYDVGPGPLSDGKPNPYAHGIEKMLGKCTFEENEERACKGTYSFQKFTLLQAINHIKIYDNVDNKYRSLSENERKTIYELAHKKADLNYTSLRKAIKLNDGSYFSSLNYGNKTKEEVEKKTKFNYLKPYHEIRKKCDLLSPDLFSSLSEDTLDKIGRIITVYKNDDKRSDELCKIGIDNDLISQLLYLNFTKTGNLSIKAMKKIMPFLEEGCTYDAACEKAGYDFRNNYQGEKTNLLEPNKILPDIPNPVVKRAVSQAIKVVNAIIKKYGSPQLICIELAREMAKDHDERIEIKKKQDKNFELNDRIINEIKELGYKPTPFDIVKYKLWKEQGEICAYSGKKITLNQLFDKDMVDIDHIIPYSKCFDDSYNNKVLVFAEENRQKGCRIPMDYLKNNPDKLHRFEIFAQNCKNYKKREKLLLNQFTDEMKNSFIDRNLNDTKYISKLLYNFIHNTLKFAPSESFKRKPVRCNNGPITDYLRKQWGIEKSRNQSDLHHAKDAAVIACTTDAMIKRISEYVKGREERFSHHYPYTDPETGEIFEKREDYDKAFGTKVPQPYKHFSEELKARLGDSPMAFGKLFLSLGYPINETVKPVFVSRMPHHSVTGAGHDATLRSIKGCPDGTVVSKTPLTKLKWDDKNGVIKGYHNKEDDILLYDALCARLAKFDYDAKKAFADEFRKPKADGTPGPIVKKVKIDSTQTISVPITSDNEKTVAASGDMVRIDVFKQNNKFYFVPIYTADTKKATLPNRAASKKPYSQWKEMKEEDFLFSLYSRDLIKITDKEPIMTLTTTGSQIDINGQLVYFIGADINTNRWSVISHDNSIAESIKDGKIKYGKRIVITNVSDIKKYQVDILGNVSEVKKETRQTFDRLKK